MHASNGPLPMGTNVWGGPSQLFLQLSAQESGRVLLPGGQVLGRSTSTPRQVVSREGVLVFPPWLVPCLRVRSTVIYHVVHALYVSLPVKQTDLLCLHIGTGGVHQRSHAAAQKSVVLGSAPSRRRRRGHRRLASQKCVVLHGLFLQRVLWPHVSTTLPALTEGFDSKGARTGHAVTLHVCAGLQVSPPTSAHTLALDAQHLFTRELPLSVDHVPIVVTGSIKVIGARQLAPEGHHARGISPQCPCAQRSSRILLSEPLRYACCIPAHLHRVACQLALHAQDPADDI
mmetsp:Transcript_2578/g.7692  ORF Transcript_2578/g.7692 Transcript_2578/m.7692 type:complete len:287 (-) Transcript_2578:275-1135(-)